MTRRAAAAVLGVLGLVAAMAVGVFLLRGEPTPLPPPAPPLSPEEATPEAGTPPPPAPPAPAPELPSLPSEPFLPSGIDPEHLVYPEGVTGPVVVGTFSMAGDSDPDPWFALESVDDPAREDPSRVEALDDWGYRLTGFAPGRYRVRARSEGGVAVYSMPFEARNGVVMDAGLLRIRRRGSIAGLLLGPDGRGVDGEVRLFGRDPASLESTVVEKAPAWVRQGFQLKPHEAGPFRLVAVGKAGYAIHDGRSDDTGMAWVEVRLLPWGRIFAAMAPPAPSPDPARVLGMTVDALEAPDLGERVHAGAYVPEATVGRLAAGRYRVVVRWTPGGEPVVAKTWSAEVRVEPGRETRLDVPRD